MYYVMQMNAEQDHAEVMNQLREIEVENRKLERVYPVILRATYSSNSNMFTIRITDQRDATTQVGAVSTNSADGVMRMLKHDLEILFGDQKLERNIGEPEHAKEAREHLGFAWDSLVSIKSSFSKIDEAIIDVEKAIETLKEYFEWAGVSGED